MAGPYNHDSNNPHPDYPDVLLSNTYFGMTAAGGGNALGAGSKIVHSNLTNADIARDCLVVSSSLQNIVVGRYSTLVHVNTLSAPRSGLPIQIGQGVRLFEAALPPRSDLQESRHYASVGRIGSERRIVSMVRTAPDMPVLGAQWVPIVIAGCWSGTPGELKARVTGTNPSGQSQGWPEFVPDDDDVIRWRKQYLNAVKIFKSIAKDWPPLGIRDVERWTP